MRILGIAGLSSSGKDTIGDALALKYGWAKISLSDVIRKALHTGNLTDSTLRQHADDLRAKKGYDILARMLIDEAEDQGLPGLILTSIRQPEEAKYIMQRSERPKDTPPLIWISGDYEFLYGRRQKRDDGRPLPSLEKFMAEQDRQFTGQGTFLHLGRVMEMIPEQYHIYNTYADKKELIAHGERLFLEHFPNVTPKQ